MDGRRRRGTVLQENYVKRDAGRSQETYAARRPRSKDDNDDKCDDNHDDDAINDDDDDDDVDDLLTF